MAAGQGASLRELMERMGHSSPRAALIYQHATRERDQAIAAGMGKLLKQAPAQGQGWRRDRARNGHGPARRHPDHGAGQLDHDPDLGWSGGAGDGNRTRMTSLEGWGSAIELRPRGGLAAPG